MLFQGSVPVRAVAEQGERLSVCEDAFEFLLLLFHKGESLHLFQKGFAQKFLLFLLLLLLLLPEIVPGEVPKKIAVGGVEILQIVEQSPGPLEEFRKFFHFASFESFLLQPDEIFVLFFSPGEAADLLIRLFQIPAGGDCPEGDRIGVFVDGELLLFKFAEQFFQRFDL